MGVEILLVTVVVGLVVLGALVGVDSRDGRDWQARSSWHGRRGEAPASDR